MAAYYNEIEPFAAAWLRNLIAAGHIAPGEVDERSIVEVRPDDLRGFTQCHFFAGIGVWSYALRRAGWPDSRFVWTGSCPCQPFSSAGKGDEFADERHLWPAWFRLIRECRPYAIFGEQVSSKDALAWFDHVRSDMEGEGYAVGVLDTCAAGVGAPHIRQRLYFVAHGDEGRRPCLGEARLHAHRESGDDAARCREDGVGQADAGLGLVQSRRFTVAGEARGGEGEGDQRQRLRLDARDGGDSGFVALGDAEREGLSQQRSERGILRGKDEPSAREAIERTGAPISYLGHAYCTGSEEFSRGRDEPARSATAGFWRDADWIACTDGKARPVEPIFEQVADGLAPSLGRVRDSCIAALEKEIGDALGREAYPGEALHDLWQTLSAQAVQKRPARGLQEVHGPQVLLYFLFQLAQQGWAFSQSLPCSSSEEAQAVLRMLSFNESASRSPRQRGLAQQHGREPADIVRVLSSILARHAQAAWGEAFDANARATFPLIVGTPNRVGRLRGYGNAINAEVARHFVMAYMDIAQ